MISLALLPLLLIGPAPALQDFGTEFDLAPVAPGARAAQFVDFDGDGDLDVLWSTRGANSVILFETLGDGSFGAGRILLPRVNGFHSALLHDFDGDGLGDLVVAGSGMTIAFGEDVLEFGAPLSIESAAWVVEWLGMADLNGDGRMDLYVRRTGQRISWYENLGSGSFAPAVDIVSPTSHASAIADMDGDGDLDFIELYDGPGTCTIYWNGANATQWTSTVIATGIIASSILTVGDLDADGRMDVGIASGQLRTLSWIRQQASGAFDAPALIATLSGSPSGMVFADTTGSGALDVVATMNNGTTPKVMLVRNAGGGLFLPPSSIADLDTSTYPTSLTAGDVDQDGDDDLLTLGSGFSIVIRGDPQGPLPFEPFPVSSNDPEEFGSADFDGGGHTDMLSVQRNRREIAAYINRGDGRSFQPKVIDSGPFAARTVDAVDWDEDGAPDVVALIERLGNVFEVSWYRGDGADGFAAPQTSYSGSAFGNLPPLMEPGDMDADGDTDWLLCIDDSGGSGVRGFRWLRNDGQGVYGLGPVNGAPAVPMGMEATDMDGDGDADAVAWDRANYSVYWRENDGSGALGLDRIIHDFTGQFTRPRKAAAGDLDGDGEVDVVMAAESGRVFWSKRMSDGSYALRPDIATFAGGVADLRLGDLDSDGDLDVMVGAFGTQSQTRYFLNGGDGVTWTPAALDATAGRTSAFFPVDLDGDSDIDLVKSHGLPNSTRSMKVNFNGRRIGIGFCGKAVPNSTGSSAFLSAEGSASVASNDLTLIAESMPAFSFGFFMVSMTSGFTPQSGGSQGDLCLGGSIGNLNRSGEVFRTGPLGAASVPLDLTNVPQPLGAVSVAPGSTWYAQAWFRDRVGSQPTSNFTNGLGITFL